MSQENQVITPADINLDSFSKLQEFASMVKFPDNLSIQVYTELTNQIRDYAYENNLSFQEARTYFDFSEHYTSFSEAMKGFHRINTKDNDKMKRTKKVSLRVIANGNQSKYVVISPGLYDWVNRPDYLTFKAKDSVLVVHECLRAGLGYKVITGQHGFMINSASLVDYLCDHFDLLDNKGEMNAKLKSFKTSFDEYEIIPLRMKDGTLTNSVYFYMAPSI